MCGRGVPRRGRDMAASLSVCHSQQLTQSILDGDSFVSRSATRNFSYCNEDILGLQHVARGSVRRSLQLQLLLATVTAAAAVHGCPMLKVYALSRLGLPREKEREKESVREREGVRERESERG